MAITVPIISQFNSKGIEQFEKEFGKLEGGAAKAAFGVKKAFAPALAVLGGVAAGAGFSVKAFADFDQSMTESTAIMSGLTDAMRDDLAVAARDVGRNTKFSATEAADALYFLASAGLDAEASVGALGSVAAFAQAGNFDMARATDILTDAQAALGLTSKDAAENLTNMTHVSDVFVKGATIANTSVEQLGEAFTEKAGAAVKAAGMEFEGAAATLLVFADQGVKGSAAGTKLTATISALQAGARKNSAAFEEFGISVYDSSGNMRSMEAIVGDMEQGFQGMSVEQRNAALASLGLNQQALDGINLLYGQSDAIGAYTEQLTASGGVTDEVAGKQMETFNAQMLLMKDRLMDAAIGFGSVLLPILQDHLMPILEKGIAFFEQNAEVIMIVVGAIAALAGVLVALNLMLKAVAIVQGVLNLVMAANPIMLIVLAVVALIAIFVLLQKRFDIVGKAMNFMRDVFTKAKDKVLTAFEGLWDWFKGLPGKLRDIGTTILNVLTTPWRTAFNQISRLWNSTIGSFSISIPSWVPIIGGKGFSFPQMPTIPALAEGGIVTRPTLALIGEAGPEAVVPLGRGGGMMGGNVVNITVTSANPEAVIDAIRQYERRNGTFSRTA